MPERAHGKMPFVPFIFSLSLPHHTKFHCMDRRKFISRSTGLLAGGLMVHYAPARLFAGADRPDLCLVESHDYYNATFRAIHELGGIRRFVQPGQSVGFLINSQFDEPGTYPHPDIALATLFLCWEAGVREIVMLQPVFDHYWKRSDKWAKHAFILDDLQEVKSNNFPAEFNDGDFRIMPTIDGAVHLKDFEIIRKISEVDIFINIPILKHHATTILTGALKNMMGLTTRKTNVSFHLGSGKRNDPEYLGQCIADLNLVRKPDLVVADAVEFITANGPGGPGPMKKLNKIVAGTDPVAVDAFGATCLDMQPDDIITVRYAHDLGIGEMDLSKLNIVELKA
jgi:uncharacterized protein (DUF362 family)